VAVGGALTGATTGSFSDLVTAESVLASTADGATVALSVKNTAASVTANLQEWANSGLGALAYMNKSGQLTATYVTTTGGMTTPAITVNGTATCQTVTATNKVSAPTVESTGDLKGVTLTVNGATTKIIRVIAHCNAMGANPLTTYVKFNDAVCLGNGAPSIDTTGTALSFGAPGYYLVRLEGYVKFSAPCYPNITMSNSGATPGATYLFGGGTTALPRVFNASETVALSKTCYVKVPDAEEKGSLMVVIIGGVSEISAVLTVEYVTSV